MSKIIWLLPIFFLIFINFPVFAEEKEKKTSKELYQEYKENVKNHCLNNIFYNKENFIYKYKEPEFQKYYPEVTKLKSNSKLKYLLESNKESFPIKAIKIKYRDIQNEIYKCGLISAKYKGINIVIENTKLDKTGNLRTIVEKKLKPIQNRLKNQFKNCNLNNQDLNLTKKRVLDQSTFELCKYSYYLDYLYQYYDDVGHVLGVDDDRKEFRKWFNKLEYNIETIASLQKNTKNQIKEEKKHSYEVFPIAFTAYSEYQSYYPVHLALELLKDNLILYRERLYKALSPINQVVYKIINAMSK